MAESVEIGKRLKAARERAGFKTARAAAESLGVTYSTYAQHENGTRGITREAELYARRFKVSLDWLLRGKGSDADTEDEDDREEPAAFRSRPNASFPPRYESFTSDGYIPLLGQSVTGPNGRFILNGAEVGRLFVPPMLEGVEGAYAVRVYGTSMEPRFKAGETVWINPNEPVRTGDDVVVQIVTDEENGRESYIKEFRSQSSKVTRLWQHNPEEGEANELTFDTKQVFSVHKIVFHATV
ncbi:XRE family transcriptional regulator [Gellertiella hungarica]|uniref:Phage repressor protein C with HTH and peptisase S24 domain n=1 Tax=Gellertiella hungarica TaxID=1572859 RepID=A0A7W6J4E3_9HYPH|nr:S24 family peptidase [Gellertiella hungarica]MBB4063648.1 phage repressor protein C with HTH and peptisase S24 domain [Gellertiella hungarica]